MDLRTTRILKGLNQYDLKLKTGIHQSKISLIERGYLVPGYVEKLKLAEALGVHISEIEWQEKSRMPRDAAKT